MTYFITASHGPDQIELRVPPDLMGMADEIRMMSETRQDRLVPSWDMMCLFPDRPELHKAVTEAEALIALGCRPVS